MTRAPKDGIGMGSPVRYTKITNNARLADRFITVQVKESSEEQDRGTIFALVEIELSWQSNAQIGQTVINSIARQYFRSEEEPALAFEEAIKAGNETLKQFAQAGEADWLGKFHAIFALVFDDELHIAHTGKVYGWLNRNGSVSALIETSTTPQNISKVFSSVLSGGIETGDRVLFSSSGTLAVLNRDQINNQILKTESLATASGHLSQLLRSRRGRWVNSILLEYPKTPEEGSSLGTVYIESNGLGDWKFRAKELTRSARQAVVVAGGWLSRIGGRSKDFLTTRLIPKTNAVTKKTTANLGETLGKIKNDTLPALKNSSIAKVGQLRERFKAEPVTAETEPIESSSTRKESESESQQEGLIGQSVFAINDYQEFSEANPPPNLGEKIVKKIPKNRFAWLSNLNWKVIGLVVLAITLLIIVGSNLRSISRQRVNEASYVEASAELTRLQDLLEEAKLALVFNQPEKAADALAEINNQLPSLFDSQVDQAARDLATEVQMELDKLTATVRITEPNLVTTQSGQRFATAGEDLMISEGKEITAVIDGKTSNLPTLSDKIIDLATFDESNKVAFLTDSGTGLLADLGTEPQASGQWKSGVALASYFDNLYILSPTDNQIWKLTASGEEYSDPTEYISDGSDIAESTDLAIDGNIFTSTTEGEIYIYTSGQRGDFKIGDFPAGVNQLERISALATSKDGSHLFGSDGERVIELDKTGNYVHQIIVEGVGKISDLSVNQDESSLYLLTEAGVVKVDLTSIN